MKTTNNNFILEIKYIVIGFTILCMCMISMSCQNKNIKDVSNKKESKKDHVKTQEEEFKEIFPNLELVSFTNSILNVKGEFEYMGDIDSDCRNINKEVWQLAKEYPTAKKLKLKLMLKGVNKYGDTQLSDLGYCEIKDLDEVRKYKSPGYYGKDLLSGGQEVFVLLTGSKKSPYYIYY